MEGEQTKTGNVPKIVEPPITVPNPRNIQASVAQVTVTSVPGQSKYVQLLNVLEELGRDIRPTYAGSRSSAERIKRGIVHARILVRECLVETERSARQ
ncbi:cyclin-dependent kinase 2-associated protein 1-like [Chelonus insularis]|uniref:cyclin-dependent kinase 2-associated protein 1-like n=1 Tax=Chelonus insularis TaxID=460826 RepID=UPI001588D644|nr:cyclin-dependent kinase 2-associated protein 1-like [Chelonus insularis]